MFKGARATLLFGTIWGLFLTYGFVWLFLIDHYPARIVLALLTTGIAACCVLVLRGVSRLLLIVPMLTSFVLLGLSIVSLFVRLIWEGFPSEGLRTYLLFHSFEIVIFIPGLLFVYGIIKILSSR